MVDVTMEESEERKLLDLPAELLQHILVRVALAHHIGRAAPTCKVVSVVARNALKALQFSSQVVTLAAYDDWVSCVAAAPDGRVLTGSEDGKIRVWRDGALERTIPAWRVQANVVMAVLPGGTHFVSGSEDDEARLWAIPPVLQSDGRVVTSRALAYLQRAMHEAERAGDLDTVRRLMALVLDETAAERTFKLPRGRSAVLCVAALPDGVHFVVGLGGRGLREEDDEPNPSEVRLYHVDGTRVHTFEGHIDSVFALAVTPDGQHIISGSRDCLVKVWSVASKSLLSTCAGHPQRDPGSVLAVAAMPDGQRILGGGHDKTVCVWQLDGTLKKCFLLHTDAVSALVALPDNQHALSGSYDGTVKLFNVNEFALLRTFKHHTARWCGSNVTSLALLPDGLRFVSGSWDTTAIIRYHGLAPAMTIVA